MLKNIILISLLLLVQSTYAAIKLPALIGNNMVLQQNSSIRVWGWADAGENVMIRASWQNETAHAITNADGSWKTTISTPKAGGPYTMIISGRDYSISLENIMIGEVWLCSGQSNMDFKLKELGGWGFYPNEVRNEALNNTNVRLFTVQKDTSAVPLANCKGNWLQADTNTLNNFSATAWFYGSYLSKKLGVPVGLIVSAWGGTPAEVWTPEASIKEEPELGYYLNRYNGTQWWPGSPGVLYNAMIHPLLNYTIRGAIWYQGESNRMDAKLYPALMNTMISAWRKAWGAGNFPFYYVQIAPFTYEEPYAGALLREAQFKCLSIPNTGMAVTMDLVDNIKDIHPKNKRDVGKRLAFWALNNTYNKTEGSFSGPLYKSMKTEDNSAVLEFTHADQGLVILKTKKNNFLIAGNDHRFYPAEVSIKGNTLKVTSQKVKQPVAVRYAFANTDEATFFNGSGLPAPSFRTDSYDIITEYAELKSYTDPDSKSLRYLLTTKARESDIYYSFSMDIHQNPIRYTTPIVPGNTGTLTAVVSRNGHLSESGRSWKIVANKASAAEVVYNSEYSKSYSAGGNQALVDGILATDNYQDGTWQGFEGNNLEATIDLGKAAPVKSISCNFISNNNSWIFLPKQVTVYISMDGVKYEEIGKKSFSADTEIKGANIQAVAFTTSNKARFIRLKAENQGKCPSWHPGAGEKAWLFVDEIVVN